MQGSDLALLVTLDALLQESSVTAAGRRVGLSTPAVSHALARLRERFDDPLLVRAGRSMVLTPRAEAMRGAVRDVVAQAQAVFEVPHDFDPASLSRAFVISLSDYVVQVVGQPFEEMVRKRAPGVDLRLVPNQVDDAELLRRGESDLAVGIYGPLPPELRMRPVLTDRFVCVVRADHPRVGKRLSLERYLQLEHVQVAPRGRPGGYVDDLLARQGRERRVARAVPFFHAAIELCARSDYVLTVSRRLAEERAAALGLRILPPPLPLEPYTLSLLWHPRFDADQAHEWLRERFVECCASVEGGRPGPARRRLDVSDPTTGRSGKRRRRA